jgi:hypothetical protein
VDRQYFFTRQSSFKKTAVFGNLFVPLAAMVGELNGMVRAFTENRPLRNYEGGLLVIREQSSPSHPSDFFGSRGSLSGPEAGLHQAMNSA